MPFTPAHAVVTLPFVKRMRAISVFGLILGSMAPDFEYFLRFKPDSLGGHSILGMFLLNLPLCIGLAIIYMNLLEDCLIQLLPEFIAIKWPRFGRNVKTYAIAEWLNFIFWTLIGMLTHLGWDSFTHNTGLFVQMFPVLKTQVSISILNLPIYKWIQHTSSLLGLMLLFIYVLLRPKRTRMPVSVVNKMQLRLIFLGIVLGLTLLRFLIFSAPAINDIGGWVVSLMSYSFISWFVLAVIMKKNERQAIQEFLTS